MIAWREYLLLFGVRGARLPVLSAFARFSRIHSLQGFYESGEDETEWFNDVHLYDTEHNGWRRVVYNSCQQRPEPRAGCQLAVHPDEGRNIIISYGGCSHPKNRNFRTFGDMWYLHMDPVLTGGDPFWERIPKKGDFPSQVRANKAMSTQTAHR